LSREIKNDGRKLDNTSNSGLPDNYIRSIVIDENGIKWIGTAGNGLAAFDGTNRTTFNTSNSALPDNDVASIAIGKNETKWIGTDYGGLAAYNKGGIPVWIPENVKTEQLIHVYPNPATNILSVKVSKDKSCKNHFSFLYFFRCFFRNANTGGFKIDSG